MDNQNMGGGQVTPQTTTRQGAMPQGRFTQEVTPQATPMQGTATFQEAPIQGTAAPQMQPMPQLQPVPVMPQTKQEMAETKRMKENFGFFGPVTFLYAVFYAFCMFKNGSGITFPFFVAASLFYLCFTLSKLELTLKKGSAFHMIRMMLLAVSTFCTDDGRIIAFNKTGIFLLVMSLLLNQFYDTKKWNLGKYLGNIFILIFAAIGELGSPFVDATRYFKQEKSKKNKTLWYVFLGAIIAIPLVAFVVAMLSIADAVFRQVTDALLSGISFENVFNIGFRIGFMFFATYLLVAFMCKRTLSEEVKDNRNGEPVLAITINSILTVIYLLFSGIQIIYLFMGKMELPDGYTYAMYAREGFFQLLAVSILNLIIVLVSMSFFRDSKVLKAVLTVMSLCTFVMIASSAMRMIIYIRFYYMTFLRILVLWALALLAVLFVGIILNIFKKDFPLFRYSMTVVTVLYLVLSFSHPDYIIAKINIANASQTLVENNVVDPKWQPASDFFLAEQRYTDFSYLSDLSADAAPAIIPYLDQLGYDVSEFYLEGDELAVKNRSEKRRTHRQDDFGYYYLRELQESTENFGPRTYNISRHMALIQIEEAAK